MLKKSPHFKHLSSGACNLRMHLKTYRGEKLNKCYQCDYASFCDMFSSLTHLFWLCHVLKEHLEIHSGEKPNKCNQCNYASSSVNSLRIHLRTHGGEKPNKYRLLITSSQHISTPQMWHISTPQSAHLYPPKKTHFTPMKFFQRGKMTKLKVKVNVFAAQVHVEDLVTWKKWTILIIGDQKSMKNLT